MTRRTRTPAEISEKVLELCVKIVPDPHPVFLPVTAEAGCNPADCFENVRKKVAKAGGRIQFGWAIWEWPQVIVEAEHHAVFDPGTGEPWQDITPCNLGHTRRLFLPDDCATYDFTNEGYRRGNVQLALSDDPDIATLIKAVRRRTQFYNGLPGVGEIAIGTAESREREKLERALANAIAALEKKYGE
jgi:hypothetical protein